MLSNTSCYRTIKLTLSYDGTRYYGWQRQDHVISIQEELEKACTKFFGQKVQIRGAGRTDAGVHARGQCASFVVRTPIPLEKVPLALNRILPDDIVVTGAQEAPGQFHPQYSAKYKTYEYQIINAAYPVPQMRHYAAFEYVPLNVEWMRQGADYFVGTHDFGGFCAATSSKKSTTRTIHYIKISQREALITVEMCGNGFLHHMIRIIVGTLIEVGKGFIRPEEIPAIISSKNRQNAGPTVPACGLTMTHVEY